MGHGARMGRSAGAGKSVVMVLALLLAIAAPTGAQPVGGQDGILHVADFGAACDGATDDAPAINAAIARARGNVHAPGQPGFRIALPAGRTCRIDASLNLTAIANRLQATIEGNGATLDCRTAGRPCIDMLGSRYIAIRDLTIEGHADATPDFGIQYGRAVPDRVADLQEFTRVAMVGRFTRANLYNRAAETVRHTSLRLWGAAPHNLVLDGINRFEVSSAFIPAAFPRDTAMSFNEPLFIQADLRNTTADGSAIWMAGVSRPTFVASYIGQAGPVAVVLWTGTGQIMALDANIHIETKGVQVAFLVAGGDGRDIVGLRYTDFASWAQRSLFALAPGVNTVRLYNLQLEVGFQNPAARVFDRPEAFLASGSVFVQNPANWNRPRRFRGMVCTPVECGFHGRMEPAPP